MAGLSVDTSTLTLIAELDDGTVVQVQGESDGVNGFEWSAMHITRNEPKPIPVTAHFEVLVDGIHDPEEN